MIDYRYDTQLLIEGTGLDEDAINDYFRTNFQGECLLAVGDDPGEVELIGLNEASATIVDRFGVHDKPEEVEKLLAGH